MRRLVEGQHRKVDKHGDWCRKLFDSLREEGVWAVPRSGLKFKRRGDQLVLIERWPEFDARNQQADFELTRHHFKHAGIEVVDESNVEE